MTDGDEWTSTTVAFIGHGRVAGSGGFEQRVGVFVASVIAVARVRARRAGTE